MGIPESCLSFAQIRSYYQKTAAKVWSSSETGTKDQF